MSMPIHGSFRAAAALAIGIAAMLPARDVRGADARETSAAPRRELFKDSRALLAMARANGRLDVSLVMAARPGQAERLAADVRRAGGRIRVQENDVGYLRARVPIERVEEIVASDAIQAADVDQDASSIPPYMQPALTPENPEARLLSSSGPSAGEDWPPSRADLTMRPIYSPLKDLGADQWRAEHPTFDGRGVTVAVLDGNVDFLLPELQAATTADGRPTRKVIDVVNSMDPLEPENDFPHWISMRDRVKTNGADVSYAGEAWRLPKPGTYAIGILDLCRYADYVQAYFRIVLDRPGRPTSLDRPIGVLWDEATGDVWIDVNQDHSFADEKPVRDFHERFDYALLGVDDPDTPVRETIPLVVQTSKADRFLAINPGMYGHSTMVSGSLLASRGAEGRFNGVAPGARLVSIFEGSTTHGMIEGIIRAFRDPRVDVVLLEQNVWIAMPYVIGDGRFTVTVIASRLIEKYRKPFLSPANNAPGLNTVEEHGLAGWSFGVGAYESRENFLANRAVRVYDEDNLHWVGSFGPSGNGALQPDILSPSEVVTTYPASRSADDEGLKGVFGFPPGYAMCGGTSCATPIAAGALSLLISGAKQSGVAWTPASLYGAVTGTARYLSNMPAYRQGNGLIQVGAAWDSLRRRAAAPAAVDVRLRAPVKTILSGWLDPPDSGPGLYEREGWRPGQTGERRLVLRRATGGAAAETFRLRWIGNDGSFSSADTVSLPKDRDVEVPVRIDARDPGVHSALLSLERAGSPDPVGRWMAVVVAAEDLNAENKFTVSKELRAPRPGAVEAFFRVPPGVDAFKVELRAPKETVRMMLYPPDSREDTVFQRAQEDVQVRTIADPQPGVWAVVLHDMHDAFKFDETRPTTLPRTPVTLTASLVGARLEHPEAAAASDSPRELRLSARNLFASFKGSVASLPLAATREKTVTLAPREQAVVDVAVTKGTQRLVARVEGAGGSGDVDLYLFDCTAKNCEPRRARVGPGGDETLSLDAPAPGAWKAVIDAARLSRPVTLTYRDYLLDPALGAVTVADSATDREPGAAWDAKASLWVAAGTAPEGRELCAMVSAAGEGIAAARQVNGTDFGNFESWKVGGDAVPLGLTTIRLTPAPIAGKGDASKNAAVPPAEAK